MQKIESVSKHALVAHGAAPWVADEVTRAVRVAESTGNIICGLYYLESYCQQLRSGRVNGSDEPVVSHVKSATIAVDAKFDFAQPAFSRALSQAVATTQQTGTCSVSVPVGTDAMSGHNGSMSLWKVKYSRLSALV